MTREETRTASLGNGRQGKSVEHEELSRKGATYVVWPLVA